MAKRHYEGGDATVLPRSIATFEAFENAMALDVAMGGSTNTVLHLLAIAQEAGVAFTMADIDRLSRKVPNICKVAPSSHYHVEDVHRAGGVFTILGELDRVGLVHRSARTVHASTIGDAIDDNDIRRQTSGAAARKRALAAPGGVRTQVAFSQDKYFAEPDVDRGNGCIRDVEHAYSRDGGLAVLYGNIATDGCILKTAGVDASVPALRGPGARLPLAGGGVRRHHGRPDQGGRRRGHRLRGTARRTRHAGDAVPDLVSEGQRARQVVRSGHGRPLQRRHVRPQHRPRVARGGRGRRHRARSKRAIGSASTSRPARSSSWSTTRSSRDDGRP